MSGEIHDSWRRLQERKTAAGLTDLGLLGDGDAIEAAVRRAFSGLDIDLEELHSQMEKARRLANVAVMIGAMGPGMAACTLFADGVADGLLIAEARQREEARS